MSETDAPRPGDVYEGRLVKACIESVTISGDGGVTLVAALSECGRPRGRRPYGLDEWQKFLERQAMQLTVRGKDCWSKLLADIKDYGA
jgi:hypothetical protein